MNLTVLLLVAIPLCAFLLIVILEMRNIHPTKKGGAPAQTPPNSSDLNIASNSEQTASSADRSAPRAAPKNLTEETPRYAFDYQGRLWVEKKSRGFFRQLRRPKLPPEDPT